MRVLVFGTYDTSMHPRVATIAEGLRASGFDVSECNAPLGLDTKSRVAALASPSKVPALLLRIARRWITLARAARKLPLQPDVVLVGYMGHFDVHLARLLFRKVPIVLDHLIGASDTARDRRLDAGPRQKLMGMIDSGALRKADVILVDTDEHLAALPDRHRDRAVVVPVGAPDAWFTAAAARADADAEAAVTAELSGEATESADEQAPGPLRVVFFGLYTPLQGAPVIGAALGSLAGEPIEVTMIGTGQDETETKTAAAANTSVRWLDWVASAELPAVVAGHDVCLGIFGTGEKALRVVPNKVFQGAAAGCAIVTSDTAPQRRTLGDAAVLVPAGDPAALADALRRLAGDREELSSLRRDAHELVQRWFAPAQVVAPLIERLDTAVPGQAGRDRAESTTMRS
jgi:glycosyltransferase involved in cell wall biosynthesis